MANSLAQRLNGFTNKLGNALFGVAPTTPIAPSSQYPVEVQDYLDNLENQEYMKPLLNQPKETGLTLDQYKEGVTQGLNFGVPEIAQEQKRLGINIPKTGEEIESAKQGTFNTFPLQSTVVAGPRQGGFFNDFFAGYRDNYDNSFNPNDYGQSKNWATRLGEGLGSIGRFIDSPLGRGLLAAGLNKAMGYNNSLQEGLTAYVGRQNNQTQDKLYRNQLKQMGYTDEELNQIRGNITADMYKNLATNTYRFRNLDQNTYVKMKNAYDKQLQAGILTPEEYKASVEALNNQYVNSQIQTMQAGNVQESNQTRNTNMNEQLLPYKQYALQMSPQIAMGNLGVARGNLALREDMAEIEAEYKQAQLQKLLDEIKNNANGGVKLTSQQKSNLNTYRKLQELKKIIEENPSATGLWQGINPAQNKIDSNTKTGQEAIKTRAMVDNLYNQIRHDYTGAQFSPKEDREYRKSIPSSWDNANEIKAKIDAQLRLYETDPRLLGNIDSQALQNNSNTGNRPKRIYN